MHPELLNNSLFLRYYKQWQDDPSSIVFAPIAEYFLMYGMIDAAFKVCREGLKRHPKLVSGRLVMARIHLNRGNWEEAEEEVKEALSIMPTNNTAKTIRAEIDEARQNEREAEKAGVSPSPGSREARESINLSDQSWHTVTMAGIFASQGHYGKARDIYNAVLKKDPNNEAAQKGIANLPAVS